MKKNLFCLRGARSRLYWESMDFDLGFLKTITNNFSDEHKVGGGPYGDVYRGVYNGEEIAVKKLHRLDDERSMIIRFKMLCCRTEDFSRVRHRNVVHFMGYCCEYDSTLLLPTTETALCFEYIQGGCLDRHISDESCDLDWSTCYRIIKGTSQGLNHLHTAQRRPILHLDLKSTNILLDQDLTPKISDLGLFDLVALTEEHRTKARRATLGYMPPEYIKSGSRTSTKNDVFSLGVIIIKIIAGNTDYSRSHEIPPKLFTDLVTENWKIRLQSTSRYSSQEADILQVKTCAGIALRCVHDDPNRRPDIKDIVTELEELEAEIKKMSPYSHLSKDLLARMEGDIQKEINMLESMVGGNRKPPRNLKLPFLQFITDNFSDELKIGTGGCGVVYKGILRNSVIAVKRFLNRHTVDDNMFHQEVKTMMMVDHKNVVRILGFCSDTGEQPNEINGQIIMAQVRERLLCFEYMSNGSLENYVTDELRGLECQTRYQIIKGICDGLRHLHIEHHIIHMDLKPANILLDNNMVPKITDFGISRSDDRSQTMNQERLVSPGYCALEYMKDGKMSAKSDIYSLGVIIQEMLTGSKREPNITEVWRRWKHRWNKSAEDALLWFKQVAICLDLAQRCTHMNPADRPNILDIISDLNKLDNIDVHTSDASEYMELEEMLGIEPLEINLPFELNKQIPSSVELTNDTDDYFAFRISTASLRPYSINANKGTLAPRSKCSVTITLQALEKTLPGNRCRDEFTVQSTRVTGSVSAKDIGGGLFREQPGKVVDTVNLTVILTEASPPGDC